MLWINTQRRWRRGGASPSMVIGSVTLSAVAVCIAQLARTPALRLLPLPPRPVEQRAAARPVGFASPRLRWLHTGRIIHCGNSAAVRC